ncbi:hypothetical protein ON010_g18904 [Phytophthora cinnamomi]|nr:hypothetical protein ON010_g18904 [Phytophthora cinnamomi]
MLKLDQAGDTLLQNPLFFAWMKYTDDFNEMYPKMRVPAITTLKTYKQYTNELLAKMVLEAEKSPSAASIAKQLQAELLENWLKSKKSPSGVFRLLGLNKVGDKAFESPVLEMWLKYVTFFKDTNPTVRVNIADILKKYFTNGVLGNMLLDAVKVPSTKKIATSTLDALTIRWIYDRAQPNEVYTWLRAAHDDVGRKLYNTYEQLYKSKYEFGR